MDEMKMDTLVTIPLKELTKYIRKIEKMKIKLAETQRSADNRYTYWQEEEAKRVKLEAENDELRRYLDDAKDQIKKLLGVDDTEKLAELQFEKGVNPDADDGR